MSHFTPEPGIAIKVEVCHSEKTGYRLTCRRLVGWITSVVEDEGTGERSTLTTPTVTTDAENGTGAYQVVRLYNVDQHAMLRAELDTLNRNVMKSVKTLVAAQKQLVNALAEYTQ